MGKHKGIAYEKHPISLERKAELRAQGLKIVDARFKPAGESTPGELDVSARGRRSSKATQAEGADTAGDA